MARFERGNQFVELWTERPVRPIDPATGERPFTWPECKLAAGRIGERVDPRTVATKHALSGEREYRVQCARVLSEGFHRVRDVARESALPDEPVNALLDAQMIADPVATAPIYGDWLQHRGHPRGELVAMQLADVPTHDYLGRNRDALLGDLYDSTLHDGQGDESEQPSIAIEWKRGFISKLRLAIEEHDVSGEDLLWRALRHPSARFLEDLEVGCYRSGDQDNHGIAAHLLHAGPTPPLRSLWLADFNTSDYDSIDISRAPIGDLRGIGVVYPLLESLILKGRGDVRLDDLELPGCKRFALRTSTMTKLTLGHIFAAPWPNLEDLELWFGDAERHYGANCTARDVAALFELKLPKLTTLRLMNNSFTDELVPMILAWPGAARLRVLDFGLAALTDEGAAELVKHRDKLPALERLGVFECSLFAPGLAELAASFPVDAGPFSGAEAVGTPRDKHGGRYSSINE